jgi:hypothetical protein
MNQPAATTPGTLPVQAIQQQQQPPAAPSKPVALTIENQKIEAHPDAKGLYLQKTADGWKLQEAAAFGSGPCFVRRDATGAVRLFTRRIPLSILAKEIVNVGGTFQITIKGYDRLNQTAALFVLKPDALVVEGKTVENPYAVYDSRNQVVRIIARAMAIGYSPTGNLVVTDAVRHYNFEAYFLQDLAAKTKHADAARYGTRHLCPFESEAVPERDDRGETFSRSKDGKKVWVFVEVKGASGLWYDPSHKEIDSVLDQHIQHQKFGDVIAQTMAERNAKKAHPAIATTTVNVVDGIGWVTVYGWRHDMNREDMKALGEKIVKGEDLGDVQVRREESEATYEEVAAERAAIAEDGQPQPGGPSPAAEAAFELGLVANLREAAARKKVDVDKLATNIFQKPLDELTAAQIANLSKVVEGTTHGQQEGGAA